MLTHQYAKNAQGDLHIFHSHQGRDNWVSDNRHTEGALSITRKQAEKLLGRDQITKLSRSRHPIHHVIPTLAPKPRD